MKNRLVVIIFGLLTTIGCKEKSSEKSITEYQEVKEVAVLTDSIHPGQKLLETQCYLCHSPSASEKQGRIAPPMVGIKAHYISVNTTKEDFINDLWNFVNEPTAENAKMRGAIKRFGLMPKQAFKKADIEKIGEYIFDYKIAEPAWFKEHWSGEMGKEMYNNKGKKQSLNIDKTAKDIGLKYALNTKKVLGKNLMGTIQKNGTLAALSFCNERAYPLTDSMAVVHTAKIKRVSDKPRNASNTANKTELEKIAFFKQELLDGNNLEPIVENIDGTNNFYYPITTNSMCLQCHGTLNKELTPETYTKIKNLYPNDLAVGYAENEVRGIWSIKFKEENNE